jgi:hypothetical protein
MSVYQLPSPPTQQPVNQLPYNGTTNQISTPKENMVSAVKTSTVTTNGQPVQVNSKAAVSGSSLKALNKRKSGYLYNPLKIDTSVISKSTPVSPTSQSSSPQPTSASSTTQSPRPTKSSSNNTFVHKLYQMLSDPKQSNFIKWNDTGLSFTIRNVQGFSHNVLPLHFRHSNFSSFVRQLNMYGFHKVNKSTPSTKGNENQVWEFYHPKFIRGKPHLIEEIKRKQIENENWRSNAILQEQGRVNFGRHNSFYGKSSLTTKRSSSTLVTTAGAINGNNITVTAPTIPSQNPPMMNAPMTNAPEVPGQNQPVYIHASEAIPANTMTAVSVTSSGETVIIDPNVVHQTTNMPIVQSVPVGANTQYGVIQVPSQNMPYNEVTATPATNGTPIPQAMTMGNIIQQNPQAMVDPANVVMNGHNGLPEVQQTVVSQPAPAQVPLEGDVYYNIQLLQMQNHDMNQRLNDLQVNVNNLMNTYSRRMDMQQNMIQQLMNSAQQQQQPQPQPQMASVTTVCSVDQGQAVVASNYDINNNQMMPQGAAIVSSNIVTQSPIAHHQMIHQSPIQANQMVVQQNGYTQQQSTSEVLVTASPEQKIMNQNQPMVKQEGMDQYSMNNANQITTGVAYPTQTIYFINFNVYLTILTFFYH